MSGCCCSGSFTRTRRCFLFGRRANSKGFPLLLTFGKSLVKRVKNTFWPLGGGSRQMSPLAPIGSFVLLHCQFVVKKSNWSPLNVTEDLSNHLPGLFSKVLPLENVFWASSQMDVWNKSNFLQKGSILCVGLTHLAIYFRFYGLSLKYRLKIHIDYLASLRYPTKFAWVILPLVRWYVLAQRWGLRERVEKLWVCLSLPWWLSVYSIKNISCCN